MKHLLLGYALILVLACNSNSVDSSEENTNNRVQVTVRHAGALKLMMHQGDISAKADLDSLKNMDHLYALGAVADLKGEILILDGKAFISYQSGFNLAVDNSFDHEAALLFYAEVEEWKAFNFENSYSDIAEMEEFIEQTAHKHGIDTTKAFPFMIKGAPGQLEWHVINWPEGDSIHSHEKHISSGITGELINKPVTILGFYSRHHHTIFTHHSTNVHMHFLSEDQKLAGHVDAMIPGEELKLLLPN